MADLGEIRGGEEQPDGDVTERASGEARQRDRELWDTAVRREHGRGGGVPQEELPRVRGV